jgi:hypothetical protein
VRGGEPLAGGGGGGGGGGFQKVRYNVQHCACCSRRFGAALAAVTDCASASCAWGCWRCTDAPRACVGRWHLPRRTI